jgi:hypothetical protein
VLCFRIRGLSGCCYSVTGGDVCCYWFADRRLPSPVSQMLAGGQDPLVGTDLWLWLMPLFLFGETILYSLMADGKSGTEKLLHLRLQFYGATRQGSVAVPISPSDMWAIAMLVVRSRVPVSACE